MSHEYWHANLVQDGPGDWRMEPDDDGWDTAHRGPACDNPDCDECGRERQENRTPDESGEG